MTIDHQGHRFLDPSEPGRQIFCNRTLNLRSLKAIGYDMDYTLLHYHVDRWEARAFHHMRRKLVDSGWPVDNIDFDPQAVCRGLIIDLELGNIVKANRFGYVKAACHGTAMLDFDVQRRFYARTVVDLAEPRWVFLNTLFSLSAGSMYRALVDLLDADQLPSGQHMNYADLYRTMQRSLDEAHMEGQLKADIIADPDQFVDLDPDTPTALLDQKQAGKKMLLITNSGWVYTLHMMTYAFDRFLPEGMTWRDLFDVIIVSARKPAFFSENLPAFEVVDDSGLLRPCNGSLEKGKAYCGGHAGLIEATLGLSSAEILYVGDHVYGDVHASKSVRRWRTALIAREMEEEVNALQAFQPQQQQLSQLMRDKVRLERRAVRIKLHQQRLGHSSPPDPDLKAQVKEALDQIQTEIAALDDRIRPLAVAASRLGNPTWGLIMRTGNDKSLMARQVERHADVYTSRVSNFLYETPFSYIRSSRGSLPHDPEGAINPFPSDGV